MKSIISKSFVSETLFDVFGSDSDSDSNSNYDTSCNKESCPKTMPVHGEECDQVNDLYAYSWRKNIDPNIAQQILVLILSFGIKPLAKVVSNILGVGDSKTPDESHCEIIYHKLVMVAISGNLDMDFSSNSSADISFPSKVSKDDVDLCAFLQQSLIDKLCCAGFKDIEVVETSSFATPKGALQNDATSISSKPFENSSNLNIEDTFQTSTSKLFTASLAGPQPWSLNILECDTLICLMVTSSITVDLVAKFNLQFQSCLHAGCNIVIIIHHDKIYTADEILSIFPLRFWTQQTQSTLRCGQWQVLTAKRRSFVINETAALFLSKAHEIEIERSLIEKVSVCISCAERQLGVISEVHTSQIVESLAQNGVCLIPGLLGADSVAPWGTAALKDMELLLETLVRDKDIDLLRKETYSSKGRFINNFHELSMREALRCDIRNVPHLKQKFAMGEDSILYKSLLPAIRTAMNPRSDKLCLERGNWGRWNFEGAGPGAPVPISIGKPGVVFSFPGCGDQTIHADTAHLFEHQHLPPHYINLFVPASETALNIPMTCKNMESRTCEGFAVGLTSFIVGSHTLDMSARLMADGDQEELERRIIRPQLMLGDALLFDCRILHFGLANNFSETENQQSAWRPIIYVNFHHSWFHDPKNWNDKEKLL